VTLDLPFLIFYGTHVHTVVGALKLLDDDDPDDVKAFSFSLNIILAKTIAYHTK